MPGIFHGLMTSLSSYFSTFADLLTRYNVLGAFWMNIQLTLWAALGSLVLGIVLTLMRISPVSSLIRVGDGIVMFFKNMPLAIVMVFLLLGCFIQLQVQLPANFDTNFYWLAITGLSLYTAPFVSESLMSGINTVPMGQAEAARSLGFGFFQSAFLIILPQAIRGAIAPLGNTLIALLKNSTVAAAAGVAAETSSLMNTMIQYNASSITQVFLLFALGYVILIIPIGLATTYLSNKLAVRR